MEITQYGKYLMKHLTFLYNLKNLKIVDHL